MPLRQPRIDMDRAFRAEATRPVAQVTMKLEAAQQIVAAQQARTPGLQTQRGGYRARSWRRGPGRFRCAYRNH